MAMDSRTNLTHGTYLARTEANSFEIEVHGQELSVDDTDISCVLEPHAERQYTLFLGSRSYLTIIEPLSDKRIRVTIDGRPVDVQIRTETDLLLESLNLDDASALKAKEVRAPMPGLVLCIAVTPGQEVNPGTALLVLEAMKMENEIRADTSGTVKAIHVKPGDSVSKQSLLISFEE